LGSQAKTPQIKAQCDLDNFHRPHHSHDARGDDEAPKKLLFFLLVFHDETSAIKNRSAAKVGNFGRKKQSFLLLQNIFSYLCPLLEIEIYLNQSNS